MLLLVYQVCSLCVWENVWKKLVLHNYSGVNSTKSPGSSAVTVRELRLMSYVRRLREVVSAYISVFLYSERTGFQQPPAYVAAAVVCLGQKDREFCQTRTEGCYAKCNVNLHCLSEMLVKWFYTFCFENISKRITVNVFMNFISEGIRAHMIKI
jgi:hypothetical protein